MTRRSHPSFDVDRLVTTGRLKRLYELLTKRHRSDPDPPARALRDIEHLLDLAFANLSKHYTEVKSAAMKAVIKLQKEALNFYDHVLHTSETPDVARLEKILRDMDEELARLGRSAEDLAPGAPKVVAPDVGGARKKLDLPEVKIPPRLASKRRRILEGLFDFVKDDPGFQNLKKIDPDAKIGVQGSIVRGTVGNPRKPTFGEAFNPGEFDLDVFVISDALPKSQKVVPLAGARDRLARRFPEALEGIKESGKGLSVKIFRTGETVPGPFLILE